MLHCGKFRAYNIWFLEDTFDFGGRELRLGICPNCKKEVGELVEIRRADGKRFSETVTGKKLNNLLTREKSHIIYTSRDISKKFKKKISVGCTVLTPM